MVKEVGLFFNMGNEMQLVYLNDIFEDNIVHDSFGTDSVNMMKNRPLVAKKEEISAYINLVHSYQKTMEIVTRNNNTQKACKPYWLVTSS